MLSIVLQIILLIEFAAFILVLFVGKVREIKCDERRTEEINKLWKAIETYGNKLDQQNGELNMLNK